MSPRRSSARLDAIALAARRARPAPRPARGAEGRRRHGPRPLAPGARPRRAARPGAACATAWPSARRWPRLVAGGAPSRWRRRRPRSPRPWPRSGPAGPDAGGVPGGAARGPRPRPAGPGPRRRLRRAGRAARARRGAAAARRQPAGGGGARSAAAAGDRPAAEGPPQRRARLFRRDQRRQGRRRCSSRRCNAAFIHRQTLANQVRFTTVELAELDARIAQAAERALAIEAETFEAWRGQAQRPGRR